MTVTCSTVIEGVKVNVRQPGEPTFNIAAVDSLTRPIDAHRVAGDRQITRCRPSSAFDISPRVLDSTDSDDRQQQHADHRSEDRQLDRDRTTITVVDAHERAVMASWFDTFHGCLHLCRYPKRQHRE